MSCKIIKINCEGDMEEAIAYLKTGKGVGLHFASLDLKQLFYKMLTEKKVK